MTKDFLLRLTEEHYGAGAFPIYGRLLEEQRLTRGGPLLPMWYCTAALRRAFGGENVLVLGCTNDSLLAHLLGATPVNPLPPHYHCPNCHHLIFDAHADDGWDLPDLVCPECGAPMAADGHDLRSRSLVGESIVSLQVPQERFAPVCAWLRDYWAQRDCQTDAEPYSDAEVMGLRLATDAWTGAERDAVERDRMAFEDVLTFREDVRKGKYAAQGMPKLIESYLRKQLRVPAHYIESMKHIRYLPRKGDCAGRMLFEGEK